MVGMQRRGVAPDVTCYGAAIGACAQVGRWQEALQLLQDMQDKKGLFAETGWATTCQALVDQQQLK